MFVQHAVDTEADAERVMFRVHVNIGRARLQRLNKHLIHALHRQREFLAAHLARNARMAHQNTEHPPRTAHPIHRRLS
jgi:hypothetical protein